MTQQESNTLGRRDFLKALLVTATAASGVGGGLAYLFNRDELTTTISTVASPTTPAVAPVASATAAQGSDSLTRLASVQADNMRLRAELDALQRQLAALDQANGDSSHMNSALRTELAAANNRVSLLAGLVALYEELEQSQLLETVDETLESFGMTIYELVNGLPSLEDGLALGQAAIDEFEAHIPALESGRHWLDNHLAVLENVYETAERVLSSVVETAGNFLLKVIPRLR